MLISCNFVIKDQEKTIITLEIWTMRSISESAISEIHFATLTYISSSLLCNRKVNARLDIYHQISSSLKPLCLGTLLMIMMTTSMHYILKKYIYSSFFFFFNTFKNCPSLQIFSLSRQFFTSLQGAESSVEKEHLWLFSASVSVPFISVPIMCFPITNLFKGENCIKMSSQLNQQNIWK